MVDGDRRSQTPWAQSATTDVTIGTPCLHPPFWIHRSEVDRVAVPVGREQRRAVYFNTRWTAEPKSNRITSRNDSPRNGVVLIELRAGGRPCED